MHTPMMHLHGNTIGLISVSVVKLQSPATMEPVANMSFGLKRSGKRQRKEVRVPMTNPNWTTASKFNSKCSKIIKRQSQTYNDMEYQ